MAIAVKDLSIFVESQRTLVHPLDDEAIGLLGSGQR